MPRHDKLKSLRIVPLGAYVFGIVFLLRLIVLVRLTESPFLLPAQGDMHFYNEWAQRIMRGEWSDHQAFYGLPLYAYLLAGFYAVFGFSPFIPGLVQVCLEAGTAAILFDLARRVFSRRDAELQSNTRMDRGTVIGLLAAAGWAFYLPAQSYSVILMPTAWLVFIFWLVVWLILRRTAAPPPLWYLALGLLIGFCAMGIATILFLLPLLIAAALFRWRSDGQSRVNWRAGAMGAALLIGGVAIGTSPAWMHNYFVARDAVFLSGHSGVNLWIGNNPEANGYPRFPPGLRAGQQAMLKDSINGAEAATGRPLKRSEVSAYWSAKANAYIRENPLAWLKLLGAKVANFWNAFQYDDISVITSLREHGVTLGGFRFGLVAALSLAGVALTVWTFSASRWVLAAVLLHMASLLSVFITERYRLAAVPGLLLFAAAWIWHLWHSIATRQHLHTLAAVALAFGASWLVSGPRGDAELWSLDAYNSGLHALDSNKLDVAERKLKFAYAYVPNNAELNFALGNLHLARDERQSAKAMYARTLALDPRHEGAFNNLGVLALQESRWDLATDFLRKALEQQPNDAKTHYLLGRALLGAGDISGAEREIARALELQPNQPEFIRFHDEVRASAASSTPR